MARIFKIMAIIFQILARIFFNAYATGAQRYEFLLVKLTLWAEKNGSIIFFLQATNLTGIAILHD
jgi:hypothetical protein